MWKVNGDGELNEKPTYMGDGIWNYIVEHTLVLIQKTFACNNSEVIWKCINELQKKLWLYSI